jgi:SAM-dependent methyltransferase
MSWTQGAPTVGMPIGLRATALAVVAVDRSIRMVMLAREKLAGRARVIHADVSNLRGVLPDETFDVILSSLVLHYIRDLSATFTEWARLLRPGGTMVFSTHHPIHPASILDPGYLCAELIEEEWDWLREKMRYYRRPLRDLTEPLAAAGFVIERISEPTPSEALKLKDPEGFDRLQRVPAFLFVRARKLPWDCRDDDQRCGLRDTDYADYGDGAFNCKSFTASGGQLNALSP